MLRLFTLLLLVSNCCIGNAKTWEVCTTCPIKSIRQAVESASAYDTILVQKGRYHCADLEIKKALYLLGDAGSVLDGQGKGYVLKILADSVTVSGFRIINSGRSYTKDFAAVYTFRASYFTLTNLEIVDPFFGILLEKSKNGVVSGNKVYGVAKREDDSGNGIHLWHCSEVLVSENEVFGLRDGIYLEFVDHSKVVGNHAHQNIRYGLHFMFSNHDQYLKNTFENNGAGVAVMFSKFIVMKDNVFTHNWGTSSYGLLLKEIYDAEVVGNVFLKNTIGVFIDGSTRIVYVENLFEQNGWAVKVSGGCYSNKFSENNFMGNSFDISYNARINNNNFDGNYWSAYSGYDLNKDGIGDIPYRPVKLFSYIVSRTPEAIILLRSLFVDIINFSEKVSPIFTPNNLVDNQPSIQAF